MCVCVQRAKVSPADGNSGDTTLMLCVPRSSVISACTNISCEITSNGAWAGYKRGFLYTNNLVSLVFRWAEAEWGGRAWCCFCSIWRGASPTLSRMRKCLCSDQSAHVEATCVQGYQVYQGYQRYDLYRAISTGQPMQKPLIKV